MSEHCGFIVKINKLEPHPNADRLQIAEFFGNSVIVDLNTKIGDMGIFFPVDLQLSEEYCAQNDLVRRKDADGNPAGGYLDPQKRNIRALKLRGAKSEGLFMPIGSLDYIFGKLHAENMLVIGDKIDVLDGHEICCKYIPKSNNVTKVKTSNHTHKHTAPIAPLFAEHADTEQLAYNLDAFKPGDQIEISLKIHGTSGRTGYLPVLKGYKRSLLDRIFRKEGKPIYDWGYVTGTRRVVLNNFDGGFYGSNEFREPHAKFFEGKLWRGETVYYEIAGFTTNGQPIMPAVSNDKVQDKNFRKQYGPTTIFSYGCEPDSKGTVFNCIENGKFYADVVKPKQSVCYVYRMTLTTEEGYVVEYTPDYMRYRCEQMGVKCVPVLWKGYIPSPVPSTFDFCDNDFVEKERSAGEYIKEIAERYYDGPDPIGKTHVREGVVVRIINRPKFCAYKHKNFSFKVLEGIAKDIADAPDMEEAQEEIKNENKN